MFDNWSRGRLFRGAVALISLSAIAVVSLLFLHLDKTGHTPSCEKDGSGDQNTECVEVFFATPREALATADVIYRPNDDGYLEPIAANNRLDSSVISLRQAFGEDPGRSLMLKYGKAVVEVPKRRIVETASETQNENSDATREDWNAEIRKNFSYDDFEIRTLRISADGILDIPTQYFSDASKAIDRADGAALVFVHGYQTSFDKSLMQAARFTTDLNFVSSEMLDSPNNASQYQVGQPFLYTWPTKIPSANRVFLAMTQGVLDGPIKAVMDELDVDPTTQNTVTSVNSAYQFLRESQKGAPVLSAASKAIVGNLGARGLTGAYKGLEESYGEFIVNYYTSTAYGVIAADGFADYLYSIIDQTDANTINIVAYSMGAQVISFGLPRFAEKYGPSLRDKLQTDNRNIEINVAYVGADVGRGVFGTQSEANGENFKANLSEAGIEIPRIAVYSSPRDTILTFSNLVNLLDFEVGPLKFSGDRQCRLGKHVSDENHNDGRCGNLFPWGDWSAAFLETVNNPESGDLGPRGMTIDTSALSKSLLQSRGNILAEHDRFQRSSRFAGDIACFFDRKNLSERKLDEMDGYFAFQTSTNPQCGGEAWDFQGDLRCEDLTFWYEKELKLRAAFDKNYEEFLKENREMILSCKDGSEGIDWFEICQKSGGWIPWCQSVNTSCRPTNIADQQVSLVRDEPWTIYFNSGEGIDEFTGKSNVSEETDFRIRSVIEEIKPFINRGNIVRIEIVGHADTVREPARNNALSEARAKYVAAKIRELIPEASNFISDEDVKWFGEDLLKITTKDDVPNASNRRVEIYIYTAENVSQVTYIDSEHCLEASDDTVGNLLDSDRDL